MKRSPTCCQNFTTMENNSKFLENVENLQFKLEIDYEKLPNDPTLESPGYKDNTRVVEK